MKLIYLLCALLCANLSLFSQDGNLDTSFGNNGQVLLPIASSNDQLRAIASQSDGKIIAVGAVESSFFKFGLCRLLADGSLDTSFGNDGIVGTTLGPLDDNATAIAIQSDDKILVTGYSFSFGAELDFVLVRYLANGELDPSFGNNGSVRTNVNSPDDFAYDLAIQEDGKILVAGYSSDPENDFLNLIRYHENGDLDSSFGNEGIANININLITPKCKALTLLNNGKIVLGGYAYTGANTDLDFVLVQLLENGQLDHSFGNQGILTTSISTATDEVSSLASLADGRLLLAGYTYNTIGSGERDFVLAQYLADGSLDSSFGDNGIVITDLNNHDDILADINIQTDGKIIAIGTSDPEFGGLGADPSSFALVRYLSNGALDPTFGDNGVVLSAATAYANVAESVLIQDDNKIVVGGFSYNGSDYDFSLSRYDVNILVSTSEVNIANEQYLIYPNPVTQATINIQVNSLQQQEIRFLFYNELGQLLNTQTSQCSEGTHAITLPIGSLTRGTYLLQFTVNDKTVYQWIEKL